MLNLHALVDSNSTVREGRKWAEGGPPPSVGLCRQTE